jgi:hypothetical protein
MILRTFDKHLTDPPFLAKEFVLKGVRRHHHHHYRPELFFSHDCLLDQWYSTFFVRVPPDIISLQLCTPKVVGV